MQDLEDMLGFRPYSFYFYMWKFVSPAVLVLLICATVIEMAISPAGYNAWVEAEVSNQKHWSCLTEKHLTKSSLLAIHLIFSPHLFSSLPSFHLILSAILIEFFWFQGTDRFQSYPPWALAMAYALIVVAMLPLPIVFIARHFSLISDGSNKLSVSYRKGMMKDISNLEEQDEQRFILSKNPSEAPSPMPAHRAYLGPGGTQEMTNTNYGTSTKTGYQNIGSPESELWSTDVKSPAIKPLPCLQRGRQWEWKRERKFTCSIHHTLTPRAKSLYSPHSAPLPFTYVSHRLVLLIACQSQTWWRAHENVRPNRYVNHLHLPGDGAEKEPNEI